MLTIGELAAFAGVSTRTIRYYHGLGLLPEPARDESGYRRYDADDVVRLVRIVALAAAGVPLVKVGDLLDADDATFAAEVRQVHTALRAEIRRLTTLRTTLADLGSRDRLALPDSLAAAIEHIRERGAPARYVDLYRDSWILAHAIYPEAIAAWVAAESIYTDPEYLDLLARMLHLAEADLDDPRLAELAVDSAAWMVRNRAAVDTSEHAELFADERSNRILTQQWVMTPAWDRLSELVLDEARALGLDVGPPPSRDGT